MAALPAVLLLRPLAVSKVWGGSRLAVAGASAEPVGESWQVYDRGARRSSLILNPELESKTIADLVERCPEALLGRARTDVRGRFPLLLKLLETRSSLSLQVHPDQEAILELGLDDEPKAEAWVVLEASPGARLLLGLAEGREPAALCEALRSGADPEPFLTSVEVVPGDAFYLPPGTVHCIGGGLLLYEIQDNSNLTLRLWDWGRLASDGKPRPLHLAQAERSLRAVEGAGRCEPEPLDDGGELLVASLGFRLSRLRPAGTVVYETQGLPQVLTRVGGPVRVSARGEDHELAPLQSCLVPAEVESFELESTGERSGAGCAVLVASPEVAYQEVA